MGDTRVNESLQRGIESAKTGNNLLARLHLLQAVELAPHDPNCWLWLAWVAESPASAVHSLKRVLDEHPDHELAQIGMRWASALANFEYQSDTTETVPADSLDADEEEPLTEPAVGEMDEEEQQTAAEDTTGSATCDEPEAEWEALDDNEDMEAAESADEEKDDEDVTDSAWDSWENASAQEESSEDLDAGESEDEGEIYCETNEEATSLNSDSEDEDVLETPESEAEDWFEEPISSESETEAEAEFQEEMAESAAIEEDEAAPETSKTPADPQADIWWQMEEDEESELAAEEETSSDREEYEQAKTDGEEFTEAASDGVEELAETDSVEADVAGVEQLTPALASKNDLETVEFELPLEEPLLEEKVSGEDTPAAEQPQAAEEGVAVLVVDDSPTVRKLVAMTLEKHGFSVESAPDGVVALKTIAEVKPRLILLDITMPRLGGYQLCKLIKKHESTKNIPVIMLSGKDGMFDKVRGKFVGCDDYITKPFDPDLLVEKVTTQLSEHYGVATT